MKKACLRINEKEQITPFKQDQSELEKNLDMWSGRYTAISCPLSRYDTWKAV
jgi:hypothetical protein